MGCSPPPCNTIVSGKPCGECDDSGGGGGPTTACAPLAFGDQTIAAGSGTRYLHPPGGWNTTADTNNVCQIMQGAGSITRLQIKIRLGAGNGEDVVYTVLLNGAPTGLTLTVPSTSAGTFDVSGSVPYVDADEISVEVSKALSVGSSPQDVQAFLQVECDGSGGGGGGDCDPLLNLFYVAKNGNDATGDGSICAPFLTLQAAYDAIGDAADNAEWNDPTKRFYRVVVAPGVYTAAGTLLPVRPNVWTYLEGAQIDGDLQLLFPNGLITSGIGSPQWGIRGDGRRAVWDGAGAHTINGVTGDIQLVMGTGQSVAFFPQIQLENTGVVGAIQMSGTYSGGQVFLEHSVVGDEIASGGPGTVSVWADGTNNETAGDIQGIGGFTGNINLFHLSDVLIRSAQPNGPTVTGWAWTDVRFLDGGNFDFSNVSGAVVVHMDEPTFREYQGAVDVVGCAGFETLASIEIMGGDPWIQQCESPIFDQWDGVTGNRVMGNIADMLPGYYHVIASGEIFKDNTAGAVIVDFGLFLNGAPIDCTARTEGLTGPAGITTTGTLTIDKIVFLTPGDNVTFEGIAPANVGLAELRDYSFRIIKVGELILHCEGG